jgi:hypothetical protein
MLALDSPRWRVLKASPGFTGELAVRLLREIRDGTGSDWAELYHQCCHQLDVGEVAYAVVPHAVAIAGRAPKQDQVWPLVIAGTVAACRAAFPSCTPPVPDDLRAAYEESARPALLLATEALRAQDWRPWQVIQLLGVVAALQGRCDLAIHLFLHGGSDSDLHCPECGEYIRWREGTDDEPG